MYQGVVNKIANNFEELKLDYNEEEKEKERLGRSKTYLNNNENQIFVKIDQIAIDKIKKKKKREEKSNEMSFGISSSSPKKKTGKNTKGNETSLSDLKVSINFNAPKYDITTYPQEVFQLINNIRQNPQSFIKDIEDSINLIKKVNDKLIYQGNLPIILHTGEQIFREAINALNNAQPMSPFVLNNDLAIQLPNEEEFKNEFEHFKKQIIDKKKEKNIERYFRDAIKDPYIGVLMMIVDDTYKNQGEKRNTILNPELKQMSINCGNIGKFLAYFTFAK